MHELNLSEVKKEWHGTLKSYFVGFFGSLILTLCSFYLVASGVLTGNALIYTIVVFALVQAVIQLLFFLHLGKEAHPRFETLIFCFMLFILLIIVILSLWIMHDLDVRVMQM